ncbi:MAG: hypothetical protein ABL934_14680 [Lysobacteraceae bacterium]
MRTAQSKLFRYCIIAVCAAVVANGCMLDRRPIIAPYTLTPGEYCPGDTLTASFDFLREATCPSGVDCSPYMPIITMSSTPADLVTPPIHDYRGSATFTPSGDRVSVHYDINLADGSTVFIPTRNPDGSVGVPIGRTNVRDGDQSATRITGSRDTELTHEGMCSGNSPVNANVELPGPPRISPNLRLVQLCNMNGIPVEVNLSGSPSGTGFSMRLEPGGCLDPAMPGVPSGVDASRVVSVRALIADPAARCSALGPNTPPATLRTLARMACR